MYDNPTIEELFKNILKSNIVSSYKAHLLINSFSYATLDYREYGFGILLLKGKDWRTGRIFKIDAPQ